MKKLKKILWDLMWKFGFKICKIGYAKFPRNWLITNACSANTKKIIIIWKEMNEKSMKLKIANPKDYQINKS
jgi:hypothetical protein